MQASDARLLMERYLAEGGASGHLMHLYDNRGLTFGELKEALSLAADGRLERVTEKLDGLNIVFTYGSDGLKAARSGGDIKAGGMDAAALAAKFQGRGNLKDAFDGAFAVLRDALGSLPASVRSKAFSNGTTWYSAEVVYSKNPNVINYDSDYVVFHASPVFKTGKDGGVSRLEDAPGVALLEKHVERMQQAVTQRSWRVRGPALLRLKQLGDGSVLTRATSAISAAQAAAGCSDADTLGTYLRNVVREEVADLGLEPAAAEAVTARVVGDPGAPRLPDIKRMVPAEQHGAVSTFVKASPALLKRAISPIEKAVHSFSVEVLRGLRSALVGDHDAEVMRLRHEVDAAVKAIQASGNATAMDVLQKQMEKLGSTDDIAAAMEGVVFVFKGNAYKFTGSFAPANQILGLFRYGRGKAQEGGRAELNAALRRLTERYDRVTE